MQREERQPPRQAGGGDDAASARSVMGVAAQWWSSGARRWSAAAAAGDSSSSSGGDIDDSDDNNRSSGGGTTPARIGQAAAAAASAPSPTSSSTVSGAPWWGSFAAGGAYGATSLVVGHPLDTLKTKMQAQQGLAGRGAVEVLTSTLRREGMVGLYRGCIPPLLGASALRSSQFGVYEATRRGLDRVIPLGEGQEPFRLLTVDWRTWVSGACGGAARALVEAPLDLAKVRRQTGGTWSFDRSLLNGLSANVVRNVGLLSTFFVLADITKERIDISPTWRPLFTGSVCSTLAWTIVWPMDVVKSAMQARSPPGGAAAAQPRPSIVTLVRELYRTQGIRAFTRGYGPGATRSIVANGLSMVVYQHALNFIEDSTTA